MRYVPMLFIVLIAACTPGCTTPCTVITDAGWVCNLEVVENVQPGTFLLVQDKKLLRLPQQPPADLRVKTLPSSIVNQTGNSDWTFDVDAGVVVPNAAANVKGNLKSKGAKSYTVNFTETTVSYLEGDEGKDPVLTLEEAKKRAEKYLEVVATDHGTVINGTLAGGGKGGPVEVLLVMETLVSKIDYTFNKSGEVGAAVTIPIDAVTVTPGVTYKDAQQHTVVFPQPLPIGFRALRLKVSAPSITQASPQIEVIGSSYYSR